MISVSPLLTGIKVRLSILGLVKEKKAELSFYIPSLILGHKPIELIQRRGISGSKNMCI